MALAACLCVQKDISRLQADLKAAKLEDKAGGPKAPGTVAGGREDDEESCDYEVEDDDIEEDGYEGEEGGR